MTWVSNRSRGNDMKTHLSVLALTMGLANSSFAEGAISGGGGKAVVCRNGANEIRSIELLDLWEARTLFGRTIQESAAPVEEQVDLLIQRLKNVTYFEAEIWQTPTRGG